MFGESLTAIKSSVMGTPAMPTSLHAGNHGDLPAGTKKAPYPKSDITINLKDHYKSKVYTSSSPVTGDVTITTRRPVPFDSVQIMLLGTTKTVHDSMNSPHNVTHTFLKMMMPVSESIYPEGKVLEPGHTYTVPFNFVIPNQLTINACNHERLSEQLQDHHVLLPPSMGGWQRDDMAPHMAEVSYTIKARVLRDDVVGETTTRSRIMETTQTIQVLPATPEQPPLNITDKDKIYRMSKTKTLRKNLLSSKLGRLTAHASQPTPAVLSSDGRRLMSHPMAHVHLTFEPETPRTLPPAVTSVSAKITSHTFYSSATISSFPNLGDWQMQPFHPDRRGHFAASTSLPAISIADQPAWTTAKPSPALARRDSGYCGSDDEDETETETSNMNKNMTATGTGATHTATLAIPLTLPTDKRAFLPTFHSCIASRVYSLQLTLQLSVRGASNTVALVVPLQIAVEGFGAGASSSSSPSAPRSDGRIAAGTGLPPSFEEAAADEHLRPRVLRMPEEGEGDGQEGEGYGGFVSGGSAGFVMGGMETEQAQGQEQDDELPGYGEAGYRRRA